MTDRSAVSRSQAAEEGQKLATRRLLLVCIPLFWGSLYIYSSYLSVYAESLNPSLSLVGVIVAAYGFTQLWLRIPIGVATDRLGRRKPFVLAGALFGALSCAALLIAPQPWVLILGRGLAGVAAACWVPLTVLLVATYPADRVVQATSMATALSAAGMTLSSALGGQLAEATNVRVPFWAGIGLGVVTAALLALVREPAAPSRKPTSVRALLSVGRIRLVLVVSLLAMVNQYISWAMTHAFVPIYARDLGASTANLGMLMSVWQGVFAIVSYLAARVAARLGARWTVVAGMVLTTVGTMLLPATRSLAMLSVLRGLHGAGVGLTMPVLMAGAVGSVPPEKRGAAMGFYQSIYAIGMVAGPAVNGVLADSLGVTATFLVTGGIAVVALAVSALVLPHRVGQASAGRP